MQKHIYVQSLLDLEIADKRTNTEWCDPARMKKQNRNEKMNCKNRQATQKLIRSSLSTIQQQKLQIPKLILV